MPMKILPLGGADEVGARCIVVGEHRLLVDAGFRMGSGDHLQDLGLSS
jgi:mRNA degradation ribonuclease J1/J2